MNKNVKNLLRFTLPAVLFVLGLNLLAQGDLTAYYRVARESASIDEMTLKVQSELEGKGFNIIGSYHPEGSNYLKVLVYTRDDLKDIAFGIKERGALAAALKVGLMRKGNQTIVSMLNPEYLFHAYLRGNISDYSALKKISDDAKSALKGLGNVFEPFGGMLSTSKLEKYHYMISMPFFDDPVELRNFSTFTDGVKTIQQNLKNEVGNCVKVYELVDTKLQVAVFGVGLLNKSDGEAHFLPIIGEDHLAAMPFELIIQGNECTMLHGRYRIALHWPELTMGTFTKIMSTPGKVENRMEALTK